MDMSNILMPLALIMAVAVFLWRLNASKRNRKKAYVSVKNQAKNKRAAPTKPLSLPDSLDDALTEGSASLIADTPDKPDSLTALSLINYQAFKDQSQPDKEFKNLRKPHPLLMSLSKNITDSQELINLVRSDPELVAKVLNLANSPLFGLSKPITDIHHAIIYLGIAQVKNLATAFAISQSFAFESERQQAAYNKTWQTSFLAGALALLVAREANLENPSELSTSCLLGYLGDITLISFEPKVANFYLNNAPLHSRIRDMQDRFKSNAAIVGGLFAQHLELPKALHESIGLGYQPLLNQWQDIDVTPEQKQNILFCYSICRVSEYLILEADSEYASAPSLDYTVTPKPELFYLQDQLEASNLGQLNALLQSPRTKTKLSQMLADLQQNSSSGIADSDAA